MKDLAQRLEEALLPFADAFDRVADPVGDAELYDEQPRTIVVTLGDCRRAERALQDARGERAANSLKAALLAIARAGAGR